MASEPKTGLTFWPPGAMQPDLLFNAMLYWLAVWAQAVVIAKEDDPPGSPSEGDTYIVGTGTGAWTGRDDDLAYWNGTGWMFFTPRPGYIVRNLDTDEVLIFGTGWTVWSGGGGGGSDVTDVQTPSNVSGTVTLDFDSKSRYVGAITLSANVTTLAFSNLPGAGKYAEYELHIAQDGTGSHTFAIPASHKALGGSDTAIASAPNAVTVLTASTVDNGTTWRYAMQESA
jgi:hypothetical protein